MPVRRGLAEPPESVILTGGYTGVCPVVGAGLRPNEVLWWHRCPVEGGWIASGIGLHTITGSVDDGTLTIRASLLCGEGCGKHGFITDMKWSEA